MSCRRFHEALAGHAAGADLDPAAAAHLAGCETCATRLELQRRLLTEVDAELERALALTASPELVARFTERVTAANAGPGTWRPAVAWIGLAAAAAIAAAVYVRVPAPAAVPRTASTSAAPSTEPAVAPRRAAERPIVAAARRETTPRAPRRAMPPGPSQAPSQEMTPAAIRPADAPPVIVDGSQLQAIARLQELVASGRLNEKALPVLHAHDTEELTISPIKIPDITVPDVDAPVRVPEIAPR